MTQSVQSGSDALRCLGASLGIAAPVAIPADAFAAPFEQLIIVYSVGRATFGEGGRFLSLQGEVFQANEVADGRWAGAWQLEVSLEGARSVPETPPPPFNRAAGRVATTDPNAFGKGRWDFADGSSLTVTGPGFVHTTTSSMLNNVVFVSGNQLISTGTGRFAGAQGTMTAAVGIWLQPGVSFADARQAEMKSLDIFRVFSGDLIGSATPPPGLGGPGAGGPGAAVPGAR